MVVMFNACEKDEIATFNGKDVVYFQWALDGVDNGVGNPLNRQIDSTGVTFAFSLPSVTDSIVEIPVKVQGFAASMDRPIGIKVLSGSTAQPGVHYQLPNQVVIPANEFVGHIPLKINRTASMLTEAFSLQIELTPNEHFETYLDGDNTSDNSSSILKYNQFEVVMSDILTEPSFWDRFLKFYLGDYSKKKHILYAEVNGLASIPTFDPPESLTVLFAQIAVFKKYIDDQKAAGTPVLEEDGSEMEYGPF